MLTARDAAPATCLKYSIHIQVAYSVNFCIYEGSHGPLHSLYNPVDPVYSFSYSSCKRQCSELVRFMLPATPRTFYTVNSPFCKSSRAEQVPEHHQ